MKRLLRTALSNGLALLAFSVIGTALLAGTYSLTLNTIAHSEQAKQQALLAQTLPEGSFDNDLTQEAAPLPADRLLGNKKASQAYLARKNGQASGVVLEVTAPDGYAGEIGLLVGILADGRIGGVRVVRHKETPGLGDYIEIKKNPWIRQFDGLSLSNPTTEQWKVQKDGGRFDYLAGATVTPRAVVKAVNKALQYFELHQAELLAKAKE